MNLYSLLRNIGIRHITLLSGLFAVLLPIVLIIGETRLFQNKKRCVIKLCAIAVYISLILYLTIFSRTGSERKIDLTPFWSYARWGDVQYRWQIYMNVFLFVPLGSLLPWALNTKFWHTALIGFLFGVAIESTQYIFAIGFCEFDDVFNNTLGTVLGYGYWLVLEKYMENILSLIKRLK